MFAFSCVNVHRATRDIQRCKAKYGAVSKPLPNTGMATELMLMDWTFTGLGGVQPPVPISLHSIHMVNRHPVRTLAPPNPIGQVRDLNEDSSASDLFFINKLLYYLRFLVH